MAYTTINKSSEYFNTKLYTGTGATQSITGVGFQPDMVWVKQRNGVAHSPIQDVVRGATSSISYIMSGVTDVGYSVSDAITSFDSDGFSLGADSSSRSNPSGGSMVSWNWKANGSGVSNTDGDITSTVSANQTAGFSISTFTVSGSGNIGVGHGLGAKPKVVITKSTSDVTNWNVYHEDTSASPENDYLFLNAGDAKASATDVWGDGMTTTTFGLGVGIGVSVGRSYVAYCFAPKKGFSKFGSYVGNGNADGTFVYTGFKPAFVITKETSDTSSWGMWDNKRLGYNPDQKRIQAEDAAAESSTGSLDLLSNGFKLTSASGSLNTSGNTFIYMAFAENPLVGTNNIPATAR